MPKIDAVQFKAMKFFLGVGKFTPHDMVEGDMGWTSGKVRRVVNMLRFWNRVLKHGQERLPKSAMEQEVSKKQKWSTFLLEKLGQIDKKEWINGRTAADLNLVKTGLMGKYEEDWKARVLNKPKLRQYKKWKCKFETEKYVYLNLPRAHRSRLAQIRGGVLPLRVETGRYHRLELEKRVCEVCQSGDVETEEHFLLYCSVYEKERETFMLNLSPVNWGQDPASLIKLLYEVYPRRLGRYVDLLWHKRYELVHVVA